LCRFYGPLCIGYNTCTMYTLFSRTNQRGLTTWRNSHSALYVNTVGPIGLCVFFTNRCRCLENDKTQQYFIHFFVMVRTTNNGGGMTLSEKFLLYFSHKAASNKNSKSLNLFICSLLWMSLQNITLLTSKRFVAFRLEQKNFWSDGLQRFWHVQQNKNTFSDCVAPKFVRPCLAE